MKHKQKRHIARKMRTTKEDLAGVALFSSGAWKQRKRLKAVKQSRQGKQYDSLDSDTV